MPGSLSARLLRLVGLLALVLFVVACGGGNGGVLTKDTPSSIYFQPDTPTATVRATATPAPQTRVISIDDEHALIDAVATGFMASDDVAGMAVAVVQKGAGGKFQTRYYDYGVTSKQMNEPVTEHSIFEIHSLSKLFTATLLAKAVVENKAHLDDPVGAHIADVTFLTFSGQPITLEQIATHRSGLPRDYPGEGGTRDTPDALLSYVSGYKLTRAPGSQYEYSNLAFGLLGLEAGRIYNLPYEALVKQAIADPLGMPDTRIVLTPEQHARKVQDYTTAGEPNSGRLEMDVGAAGALSLHSTTVDLAKFLIANMAPESTPLGPWFSLAQKRYEMRNNNDGSSGLAWEIEHAGKPEEQLWKNGAGAGGTTYMWFSRATQTGVIVLTNKGVTNTPDGIPNSPSAADRVGGVLDAIFAQPTSLSLNPSHTSLNVIARQTLLDGSRRVYLRIEGGKTADVALLSSSERTSTFTVSPEIAAGPPVWLTYTDASVLTVTFPPGTPPATYQLTAKTSKGTYNLAITVAAP